MRNAPFKFAPKDYFGFFAGHGWHLREIRYLAEEADRLRRPIQFPPILRIRRLFASKKRQASFRKFQGYVLFGNQNHG